MTDQIQTPTDEDIDIDPFAPVDEGEDHTNPTLGTGDITDHERALLTDEELQGVLESEGLSDDADAAVQDDAAPAAAVEAETPAPAATQPEQAPANEPPAATGLTDDQISAAKAGLEAAKAARKALLDQYDDGELTAAERDAGMEEVDGQIAQHAGTLRLAEDAYNATVKEFRTVATTYLDQNTFLADEEHVYHFDRHVRTVSKSAEAATMSYQQILDAAHRAYRAEAAQHGIYLPAAAAAAAAPKPTPAAPTPPKLEPKPEAPMTLAKVPAAGMTGPNEGPLGQLHLEWQKIGDDTAAQERFMAKLARDPDVESAFLQAYG
jgi:hypothetical protein